MQVRLGRMEWIVWSGWRDLNSRPLDPQTSAACPPTSSDVRFSLNIGISHLGVLRQRELDALRAWAGAARGGAGRLAISHDAPLAPTAHPRHKTCSHYARAGNTPCVVRRVSSLRCPRLC